LLDHFCRSYGGKFQWLMPRDDYWQMLSKILITSILFYFLIGDEIVGLPGVLFFPTNCNYLLFSISAELFLVSQLCAIAQFWLYLRLSDAYEYQLCWLVSEHFFLKWIILRMGAGIPILKFFICWNFILAFFKYEILNLVELIWI
jgi:hypothetical protein